MKDQDRNYVDNAVLTCRQQGYQDLVKARQELESKIKALGDKFQLFVLASDFEEHWTKPIPEKIIPAKPAMLEYRRKKED